LKILKNLAKAEQENSTDEHSTLVIKREEKSIEVSERTLAKGKKKRR